MTALTVACITFASTFSCAMAAMRISSWLPQSHLSKETQDVVRLGIGLVATMTALLLGLVTAAARNTFDAQEALSRDQAAAVLTLDRDLARFGPETTLGRELIRRAVVFRLKTFWPEDEAHGSALVNINANSPTVEEAHNEILNLVPQNDVQRWLKADALRLSDDIIKARWRVLSSGGSSVPRPFLVVVVFWLIVIFSSFGLCAPRNGTVIAVLFVSAFSVAAAMFLILELDSPLDGLIRISSGPWQYVLANLGK